MAIKCEIERILIDTVSTQDIKLHVILIRCMLDVINKKITFFASMFDEERERKKGILKSSMTDKSRKIDNVGSKANERFQFVVIIRTMKDLIFI